MHIPGPAALQPFFSPASTPSTPPAHHQATFETNDTDTGAATGAGMQNTYTDSKNGIRLKRAAPAATMPVSTRLRADILFARAYANTFDCTLAQARKKLRQADRTLYESWRNLRDIREVAWIPADSDAPRSSHDLAHAATLFTSYLCKYPNLDQATALNSARLYLTTPAVMLLEDNDLADLYQGVLQRGLHWINLEKVHAKGLSATQILQTVCRHRQADPDTRAALAERLRHYRDVIIDEAATIAFYAQSDPVAIARGAPIHVIRAQYATALIDEWQDAALGQRLLPSAPIAPLHAKFWHDGAVIHNTRGMGLEQIVSALYDGAPYAEEPESMQTLIEHASKARHLLGQPPAPISTAERETLINTMHGDISAISRYPQRPETVSISGVWLTRDELYAVVEKAMRNLALDTDYAGGTPLHAVATIVHRLGPLHGIDFDEFNNPAALMSTFNRLERAWANDPHFAIQPSLCAAYYLAQASDVLFLDTQSPRSRKQQIMQQASSDLITALRKTGAGLNIETGDWNWDMMREVFAKNDQAIYKSLKTRIQAMERAPETIRYAGTADLNRQLDGYLKQRLLAQAPLPVYDEDFLIEQILRRKLSMTDADLHRSRWVQRTRSGGFGSVPLHVRTQMTPREEFKSHSYNSDLIMASKGKVIHPARELKTAREQALAALVDDPGINAKAMEVLRQHATVNDLGNVDSIRYALAHSIVGLPNTSSLDELLAILTALFGSPTITAFVNALGSGEPRQILELLPFVIPLYDIEEGIRLGDRQRAFDGAIHFGEDAIFTALGAGAETILRRQLAHDAEAMLLARTRMAPAERAGVDMMHEMAELFPEARPERLAQQRVTVAEDVFNIRTPADTATGSSAQTLPKTRPVATPVRQTLYLTDEKRDVLVQPSGADFFETDLRGNIIYDAPSIFGDPKSGSGYRLGRHFGRPGGAAGISIPDLLTRNTVSTVQRYWQSIASLPNVRVKRLDPKGIINALFEPSDHPLYGEFERFWQKAYALSETAVAILNAAYHNRLSRCINCEIEFNGNSARVIGNTICFLSDKALADLEYASTDGMTPFQRSRMWVHEAVHWLTELTDAPEHLANDMRGGTTYTTDRILSELGSYPPILPRAAYKAPPLFETDESAHRAWARNLRQLNDWSIAENNFLDKQLDAGRDYPSTLVLMGQKITDRVTVRQGLALARHIKSLGILGDGNAEHLFQLVAAAFNPSASALSRRTMLRTLISRSKTFRMLAAAWSAKTKHARINIELQAFDTESPRTGSLRRESHYISRNGKTIWLNTQAQYYFSDFDLTDVSAMRRYVGAMIDLFLKDTIPAEQYLLLPNPFVERGLRVLLEDEVLQQIGDKSPRRICAALTADLDAYLRHQTSTSRAAVSENGYLRKACRGDAPAQSRYAEDDILGLSA